MRILANLIEVISTFIMFFISIPLTVVAILSFTDPTARVIASIVSVVILTCLHLAFGAVVGKLVDKLRK